MLGTRYEEYGRWNEGLPFVLHSELERTPLRHSNEQNWHEEPELQLCLAGRGTVLLNGIPYEFLPGDIIAVNANVIHYTYTEERLQYTCLIVSTSFCGQMGLDCRTLTFSPRIRNPRLTSLLTELSEVYREEQLPFRIARANELLLRILLLLATEHTDTPQGAAVKEREFETVKATLRYVRTNYAQKLSLDKIARAVYTDKYALCRTFKRLTDQTVVEYLNRYRCGRAAEYLLEGYPVAEAARACGFETLSYFSKTFRNYMGMSPSRYQAVGRRSAE